jgi:integrase
MARPRIPNKNRLYHPLYSVAYLERRYERYYVVLKGRRTNTELDWKPENKALALKILERIVLEHLNPAPKQVEETITVITIADALEIWSQIQKQRTKQDSLRKIRNAFTNILPNTSLRLAETERIRTTVMENMNRLTVMNNTKHKQLSWIRQFFGFCVDEGYCERNPITKAMFPKQTRIDRDAFTDAEMDAIVQHFKAGKGGERAQFVLLLEFIRWSGVHINEALTIQWSDINEKRVFVREGKGGGRSGRYRLRRFRRCRRCYGK